MIKNHTDSEWANCFLAYILIIRDDIMLLIGRKYEVNERGSKLTGKRRFEQLSSFPFFFASKMVIILHSWEGGQGGPWALSDFEKLPWALSAGSKMGRSAERWFFPIFPIFSRFYEIFEVDF